MGCAYSSNGRAIFRKINDSNSLLHPKKIFKVINVDESGNEISLGHIEITSTELILHQKGRPPIAWSLRSIRRYGFDSQLFSFECGRRCPTGPGVYGFKCPQAEQLFNILQESVQKCSSSTADPLPFSNEVCDLNLQGATGIVPLSINSNTFNNFGLSQKHQDNPRFANDDDMRHEPNSPSSASTGSAFPNSAAPDPPMNTANNSPLRLNSITQNASTKYMNNMRDYVNSPSYMNTSNGFAFQTSENSINASPEKSPVRTTFGNRIEEMQPYVNVQLSSNGTPLPKVIENDDAQEFTINYTTLDLDNPCFSSEGANNNHLSNGVTVLTAPVTPISKHFKSDFNGISPPRTPASNQSDDVLTICSSANRSIPYVAIDFDKTVALSNSAATHRKEILHQS